MRQAVLLSAGKVTVPAGAHAALLRRPIFGPDGAPLGPDFPASSHRSEIQLLPQVAMNAVGSVVITWVGSDGNSSPNIFARQFSSNGLPLGDEFIVNTRKGNEDGPSIGIDSAGEYVVTWTDRGPSPPDYSDVYARLFAPGIAPGSIMSRHVFYNNSKFDGNNAAANSSDDDAVTPDKVPLCPVTRRHSRTTPAIVAASMASSSTCKA